MAAYTWEQLSGRSTKLVMFDTVGGLRLNFGSAESFFQSGSALNFAHVASSAAISGKLNMYVKLGNCGPINASA